VSGEEEERGSIERGSVARGAWRAFHRSTLDPRPSTLPDPAPRPVGREKEGSGDDHDPGEHADVEEKPGGGVENNHERIRGSPGGAVEKKENNRSVEDRAEPACGVSDP